MKVMRRRAARLAEILESIPRNQKRLSIKTYHKILGELRSMSIALPGSRGLFGILQDALRHQQDHRLCLTKDFHDALDDFRWIHHELTNRPTRLQEIVPTPPTLIGAHDASGAGAGGILLPTASAVPRKTDVQYLCNGILHREKLQPNHPIVWRHPFHPSVTRQLVTWEQPNGTINNSELELAGGFVCYDIREERTVKFCTDNTAAMYWMRKGTITGRNVTTKLLRMQSLHQRFHRYVHLIDYLEGERNNMADNASRLNHLNDSQFLAHFNTVYPQEKSWRLWSLPLPMISSITTSLHNKMSPKESWLREPMPPSDIGGSGPPSVPNWDWILPYKTLKTPSRSSKSLPTAIGTASSIHPNPTSVLEQWRMPYEALAKRSKRWGPKQDPRHNTAGKTDFRLLRMLNAYGKQDPPPNRVKPIPVQVLQRISSIAAHATDAKTRAIADMITIAFFFLLRPGEYTASKSDTTPFRMQDVGVFIGNHRLNTSTTPVTELWNATFVTLEFTTQKNGVRGEVIGLGRSGNTDFCPVFATVCRLIHLHNHGAPPHTPLATAFHCSNGTLRPVTPTDVTNTLRLATQLLGPSLGFLPKDISAHSLCAAGTMALLCAHVDTDVIRLLGRWRSDEMLRYLHVQAAPVMRDFSSLMLKGGHFELYPNHEVPLL